ncbi:hypothetical protein AAHC03_016810 [Spirometra sp. Aus1]
MGDVALSESDMKAMQAQKDYGESSSSSSDWTDDEDSDEFDVHSEVEASQYDLAESMNWDLTNSTRYADPVLRCLMVAGLYTLSS